MNPQNSLKIKESWGLFLIREITLRSFLGFSQSNRKRLIEIGWADTYSFTSWILSRRVHLLEAWRLSSACGVLCPSEWYWLGSSPDRQDPRIEKSPRIIGCKWFVGILYTLLLEVRLWSFPGLLRVHPSPYSTAIPRGFLLCGLRVVHLAVFDIRR